MLSVLQSDTTSSTTELGPTMFASVAVDGVTTKALIDTWSPATIVSLKFILQVFAGQKTPKQTLQQWKENVRKRFLTLTSRYRNTEDMDLTFWPEYMLTSPEVGGR